MAKLKLSSREKTHLAYLHPLLVGPLTSFAFVLLSTRTMPKRPLSLRFPE